MVLHVKIVLPTRVWKFFNVVKRIFRTIKPCLMGFFLVLFMLFTLYWKLLKEDLSVFYTPEINGARRLQEIRLRNALVMDKELGCVMPKMDPFAPEIMKYNKDMPKIVCKGTDWVECNFTKCKVKQQILDTMDNVKCYYKDIIYVNDNYFYKSHATMVKGNEVYNLNASDHVKVSCSGEKNIGLNMFAHRWFGYKAGFRPVHRNPPKSPNALNVLMVIFDSVSRNGFMRKLPKSYNVLVKELGAVVMKGYNIVGDATVSAMLPILTGRTVVETPDWRKSVNNTRQIDIEPFIFTLLKNKGYRTAYFEDRPRIGTFQYSLNGFKEQPTDHYLRPFCLEQTKYEITWWMGLSQRHCVGDTPRYMLLLNLIKQFNKLDGYKFGISFISELSHDDFNLLSVADDDLVNFLRDFKNEGMMEDTLLFVMSDHGPRFDYLRDTYQGKLEERLPMVSVVLPQKLKRLKPKALENLRNNADVLTTPFDIHTTLLDALDFKEYRNKYKVPGSKLYRGISFLEPIPTTRSCSEAGVLFHWCACINWINLTQTNPIFTKTAQALADFINSLTESHRDICAKRELVSIEWVLHLTSYENIVLNKTEIKMIKTSQTPKKEFFQAKIIMNPKKAVYEGSMVYDLEKGKFELSTTDISRVNPYGNEPECISGTEPFLNKFCYCKSVI